MKPEVAAWISILAKRLRIPLFRECDPLLREACEQGVGLQVLPAALGTGGSAEGRKSTEEAVVGGTFSCGKKP
ncbi:MAG TPA: hypothetical protein PLT52_02915 [Acetomicrobium sp.]|uniref:hypothetical protein n=1 Tax=Acetomicrobium sp. TaxID=1872099 RepID=UPI002B2616F5|nr:hypothetical protein [Acetomicrobium sp.]HPT64835.1 hypothetical protein [Acetomicrobium sp.]